MKFQGIKIFQLSLLGLTACQGLVDPKIVTDQQQNYSLTGVKAIRASSNDPADASSFGQQSFTIESDARLLLRFEELSKYVNEVRTEDGKKVELLISPSNASAQGMDDAQKDLSVCAVTRNWMMLSTWTRAFPFDGTGRWAQPGGDFDSNECFSAATTEGSTLVFDVTQWFVDYVRGKNVNYGLIMKSENPITVEGDQSGAFAPRLRWKKSSI